ncbi:hypothetical protein ACLB1E_09605 [Escherichia coli]
MNDVVAILENHPLLGAGFAHKIEQLQDNTGARMDGSTRCALVNDVAQPAVHVPDERQCDVIFEGLAFGAGYPSNHLSVPATA